MTAYRAYSNLPEEDNQALKKYNSLNKLKDPLRNFADSFVDPSQRSNLMIS
jgi:hypothetical protein